MNATSNWTAIVPIKPAPARKVRLAMTDGAARMALTERMLAHVLAVLDGHPLVARTLVLAHAPLPGRGWIADTGLGLNGEIQAARAAVPGDMLVVHADLPTLEEDDVTALLAAAERHAIAIAPDRHGSGTNAIALKAGTPFTFRFGPDSRHLHGTGLPPGAHVIRSGLALDIDTPEDLLMAGLVP